jgi:hypothetical protein
MENKDDFVGYLKYTGKAVENGAMDVRKSAEALLGLDEILRYFLFKEDPSLENVSFEMPVQIRKGSWEALILEMIVTLTSLKGASGAAGLLYMGATVKQAAQEGFSETGFAKDIKKIFKAAISAAQWSIKIASHVGSMTKKKFEIKIEQTNLGAVIKVPNEKGEYLDVPKKYFDLFIGCPGHLFSKNASLVEEDRTLEIGVCEAGTITKTAITKNEKDIFCEEADGEDGEILFPELLHGQYIELSGEITRVNENNNTIGFKYDGHILICKPRTGGLARFKRKVLSQEEGHVLAQKVIISGIIDRVDKHGDFKEKRPTIFFVDIEPVLALPDDRQSSFFDS